MAISLSALTGCGSADDKKIGNVGDRITVKVIKCGYGDKATQNDVVWDAIHEKFQKDTGIDIEFDIEFVPWEEATTRITTKITANEKFDIFMNQLISMGDMAKEENHPMMHLDDIMAENGKNFLDFIPQRSLDLNTRHGHLIGIPLDWQSAAYWFVARTDKMTEWGLSMPDTLAEFEAVMAEMKQKDPNCIPLTGASWSIGRVIMALANLPEAYHNSLYLDKTDGKIKANYVNPNYKTYLEIYARWVKNGWISKDSISMQTETANTMFISGKSYIKADWATNPLYQDIKSIQKSTPAATVAMMPIFKGVDGVARVHAENPTSINYCAYKGANKEAVKAFVKYIDWTLEDPANYRLANYGIEGTHYDVVDGVAVSKPEYAGLGESGPYAGLYGFFTTINSKYFLSTSEYGPDYNDAFNTLISAEKTDISVDGLYFDYTPIAAKATAAQNFFFPLSDMFCLGKKDLSELAASQQEYLAKGGNAITEEFTRQYNEKYKGK